MANTLESDQNLLSPSPMATPSNSILAEGMTEEGNIDLDHRPVAENADGSKSTVRSMGISDEKGSTLIPTVVNGKVVSNEEAIARYKQTGEHLGRFQDDASANAYAEKLHQAQEQQHAPPPPPVPGSAEDMYEKYANNKLADEQQDPYEKYAGNKTEEDPYEKYAHSITEEQPIKPNAPIWKRIMYGMWFGNAIEATGEQHDSSFHDAWAHVKDAYLAGAKPDELGKSLQYNNDYFPQAFGPQDRFGGWAAIHKVVDGAEAFGSMVNGLTYGGLAAFNEVERWKTMGRYGVEPKKLLEVLSTPYSPDVPSIGDLVGNTITGAVLSPLLPGKLPSGESVLARIEHNAEGKLIAKPIGGMPTSEHFAWAADQMGAQTPAKAVEVTKVLKDAWNEQGIHPFEVLDAYKEHPVVRNTIESAKSVGAAQSPPVHIPARPSKTFLHEDVDGGFGSLRRNNEADKSEMGHRLDDMGAIPRERDEFSMRYGEGDPLHYGEQVDIDWYNKHLLPLQMEKRELFAKMSKHGFSPEDLDLAMHRMLIGKTPEIDRWLGEGSASSGELGPAGAARPKDIANSVVNLKDWLKEKLGTVSQRNAENESGMGLLSKTTGSLKNAKYYALENMKTGERRLVAMGDKGRTLRSIDKTTNPTAKEIEYDHYRTGKLDKDGDPAMSKKTGEQIQTARFEQATSPTGKPLFEDDGTPIMRQVDHGLHEGDEIEHEGEHYKLRRAWVREIEANTSNRYYHSGVASLMNDVLHLRAVDRAVGFLKALENTPEFEKYTSTEKRFDNWMKPDMPLFQHLWMDPRLAYKVEDFWKRSEHDPVTNVLEKINSFAIGSMFWDFFPHGFNHTYQWAVERGWDWVNPMGYYRMAVGFPKALDEVRRQGAAYQATMRAGADMQYAPFANRGFIQKVLQRTGQDLERNGGWGRVAESFGMAPATAYQAVMDSSNRILWSWGDVLKMQRVMELQDKGKFSLQQAVKITEKIQPKYDVPSTLMGSRDFAKIWRNPSFFEFSRWHWSLLQAYGHMARDMAVGTGEERMRALGQLAAIAFLQIIVFPGLSAVIDKATGNDDLRIPSFGMGKLMEPAIARLVQHDTGHWLPHFVHKYYDDENKAWADALLGLLPASPAVQFMVGMGPWNIDVGRHGAHVAPTSDDTTWGEWLANKAEFGGQTMFSPWKDIAEAWRWGESPTSALIQKIFALQNRGADQEAAAEKAEKWKRRERRGFERHPRGPLADWGSELQIPGLD